MLALIALALMTTEPDGAMLAPPPGAEPSSETIIRNPEWLERPGASEFSRYYPRRARQKEVEGRVTLKCRVTVNGALTDCTTTGEQPPGAGFGEAALKMARKFRMRPRMEDGRPVEGGGITIPIRFRLVDDPNAVMIPTWVVYAVPAVLLSILAGGAFLLWGLFRRRREDGGPLVR